MKTDSLSNIEKRQLSYQRQNAVRQAWKLEKNRVLSGYGTRNWSKEEQKELISEGYVQGYEGHHMKSVSMFPEYAGNPMNIQFLSESEHLYGAHQGNYHYPTNGYYDPETRVMHEFDGENIEELPTVIFGASEISVESEPDKDRSTLMEEYQKAYEKEEIHDLSSEREALTNHYHASAITSDDSAINSQKSEENQSVESGYGNERGYS